MWKIPLMLLFDRFVGILIKAVLENETHAEEYGRDVIANNERILTPLAKDLSNQFLFAMTPQRVLKVAVQNCAQYQSCTECLGTIIVC